MTTCRIKLYFKRTTNERFSDTWVLRVTLETADGLQTVAQELLTDYSKKHRPPPPKVTVPEALLLRKLAEATHAG